MLFDIGPFRLYRPTSGSINISLIRYDDKPFGWEYGWNDDIGKRPLIKLSIGKLTVFQFEKFKNNGFEIWFLGFWWIH